MNLCPVLIFLFASARFPCNALLVDEKTLQKSKPMQIVVEGRDLRIKKAAQGRPWEK